MLKSHLLGAVGIVAVVGIAGLRAAQVPDKVSFEVASIKLNKSGPLRSGGPAPAGRFTATYATLSQLVENAYGLRDAQVIGGPSWIRSDRFDVAATMTGNPTSEQQRIMLENLLADRFSLSVHHETRDLTELTLVAARRDKKLGPRLQPASAKDAECSVRGEPAAVLPNGPLVPNCGMLLGLQGSVGVWVRGLSMDRFARILESSLPDRPIVINRTGLDGAFNLGLEWTDERMPRPDGTPSSSPADVPSIFTAIQEQLGLKLISTKGPVDVVVIDHVERPTED